MEAANKTTCSITVLGMTCAGCVRIVEKSLMQVDGVKFAAVNLATSTAFAVLDKPVPLEVLEEAIRRAGYQTSRERPLDAERKRYQAARRNMAVAVIAMIPPTVLMGFHMAGHHVPYAVWINLVCGAAAIFAAGAGVLKSSWIALSHGHANMDVLVALSALAAWLTCALEAAGFHIPSFGMLAPMIVTLHLIGRYIESRLRDRAAREIRALLTIQSKDARLVSDDGVTTTVPIELLQPEQVIRVMAGERIPADGQVLTGTGSVDEAMLTGEPIPSAKSAGDDVTGGSVLVSGQLDVQVTHVGEDSFLSQIIAIIQEAQGAKIPIQAFADRVTGAFVPLVAGLAVIAGVFWLLTGDRFYSFLDAARQYLPWVTSLRSPGDLALFAFLSTLLIACPCALGLATPMALISATGAASRRGVIIRNAEAVQTLGSVSVAVLDKTGTLTLGRPEVVWHNLPDDALSTVASIEAASSHPLAKAISALCPNVRPASDVSEEAGQGVSARVDGCLWVIGRLISKRLPEVQEQLALGRTVVQVTKDGQPIGLIALQDPIRPGAKEMVSRLIDQGVQPVMATGDNDAAAERVARAVGISEWLSEVRPEEKLKIVRRYQSQGHKVVMLGDGINDAAGLKGADVGIAVGSGSELAVDNADAVIVQMDQPALPDVIAVSRLSFQVIRQNLFWAFGYNFVALPLAMAALLHPLIAEAAMTLSSISVIANSSRINRK